MNEVVIPLIRGIVMSLGGFMRVLMGVMMLATFIPLYGIVAGFMFFNKREHPHGAAGRYEFLRVGYNGVGSR